MFLFYSATMNYRILQKPSVQKPFLKHRQYDNSKRAAAASKRKTFLNVSLTY